MKAETISNALRDQIGSAEVVAAVFTTYTLDTGFFEQDVIPLLLPGTTGFSLDPELRLPAIREKLQTSDLLIDIFADSRMFWADDVRSPTMDYGCFLVDLGNRAFHGKILLLLLRDPDGAEHLHVAAGSCNLTRAGWWDNIECQHWERIDPGTVRQDFLEAVRRDVAYLREIRSRQIKSGEYGDALTQVSRFLDRCPAAPGQSVFRYFGLAQRKDEKTSFPDFLKQGVADFDIGLCEGVEIISPFFAEDSTNNLHAELVSKVLGSECRTRLLLPVDDKGDGLCTPEYFAHIQQDKDVEWSGWHPDLRGALGMTEGQYRPLHAKVFQVLGEKRSATFVGSINFTHKAMHENVEAGFLVPLPRRKPILRTLDPSIDVSISQQALQHPPGSEEDSESTLPTVRLSLHFDWLENTLEAIYEGSDPTEITLLGADGESKPLVSNWRLAGEGEPEKSLSFRLPDEFDLAPLREHLKHSGVVTVLARIASEKGDGVSVRQYCLVQQSHWTHKPPVQPVHLSDAQILAVYSGMSAEDRQVMINNARLRALMLQGLISLEDAVDSDPVQSEFFAKYAEIFHAFRTLRKRLAESPDARIDYYLTGAGPDSLPSLIDVAMHPEAAEQAPVEADHVSTYLILLSALELYGLAAFRRRAGVRHKVAQIEAKLREIRAVISLPEDQPREVFFDWFEKQFFEEYRIAEAGT